MGITQTNDNVRLRIGVWKAKTTHKGTVLLFPGRSEYLERFGRTVSELHSSGYCTLAIDWRGHGLSDRVAKDPRACHVNLFTDYQKDVAAMVASAEELDLPKPWFLLGNSMGAIIGLRALIEDLPVVACAFTAPMWNIKMSPIQRCVAWPLSWAAQAVGKGQIYTPGYDSQSYVLKTHFQGNKVTSDKETYQILIRQAQTLPGLEIGGASMGWLYQGLKECRSLSKLGSPDIPCISFCGDLDEVVDIQAIEKRMNCWPEGRFELVKNAKHELVMETAPIREKVLGSVCDFFQIGDIPSTT